MEPTDARAQRVTALAYRSDGFLDNILDPLLHRTVFGYDLAALAPTLAARSFVYW